MLFLTYNNNHKPKNDIPIKETNSDADINVLTLEDIWFPVIVIEVKVKSNESDLKDISSRIKCIEYKFTS